MEKIQWVAVEHRLIDLDAERAIAVTTKTGRSWVLDRTEADVLRALVDSDTLIGLEKKLTAKDWDSTGLRELAGVLDGLHKAHVVVHAEQLLPAREVEPNWSSPGLRALTWMTCDRPESMAATLGAWRSTVETNFMNLPDFVIADDSKKDTEATRKVVEAFAEVYAGNTVYLSRSSRQTMLSSFSEAMKESVAFALGINGPPTPKSGTYGSAANQLLLRQGGCLFTMGDDDVFPDFRVRNDAKPGLALSSSGDPALLTPLAQPQEMSGYGVPARRGDFFAHQTYLGRSVKNLLGSEEVVAHDIRARDLDRLSLPEARVAALVFHYWGDSGVNEHRFLLSQRKLIDPAAYTEARYEEIRQGRLVFRAPFRDSLGNGTVLNGHLCLDGRSMLPPFSPFGRNHDGLWSTCVSLLHPEYFLLYPQEAILHKPVMPRQGKDPGDFTIRDEINTWIIWLLNDFANKMAPLIPSYQQVGRWLSDWATRPLPELRGSLLELHTRVQLSRLGALARAREEYQGPASWNRDIETALNDLETSLEPEDRWVAQEFVDSPDEIGPFIANFGRLLAAWPQIWEEAIKVRQMTGTDLDPTTN